MSLHNSIIESVKTRATFASRSKVEDEEEEEGNIKEKYAVKRPSGVCASPRHMCGYLVNHPIVDRFILGCIIGNTILLGIAASDLAYPETPEKDNIKTVLDDIDFIFLIIFTVESGLQLMYHGFALFKDPWLTFDFSLVTISWVSENSSTFENLNVRSFRVLRALRLFAIGPIRDLIRAITAVTPRLSVIALLSLLMLYIFDVLFTQLFKKYTPTNYPDIVETDYFGRLDVTMFTLLQMMTMDFSDPMRSMMEIQQWAWFPFIIFLVVMGFLMFNLMAAVICDAIGALNDNESEELKLIVQQIEDKKKLFIASSQIKLLIDCQKDIEDMLQAMAKTLMENDEFDKYHKSSKVMELPDGHFITEDPFQDESEDDARSKLPKPKGCYAMERYAVGKFINHPYVQGFILVCIIGNCFVMGLQATDLNYPEKESYTGMFDSIDKTFLITFTIESGLQFFYRGIYLFRDAWLTFDLLIVIFSWALENLQVVRAFRVLRAIRVTVRVDAIRDLILAIFVVIPKLSAIVLLILLMFYIFGVLFTQLFKDFFKTYNGVDYFSRLDYTLFTLIQMMTLDFGTPMRVLLPSYPQCWIPFLVFIIFMGLLFFNLMAAVICDAIGNLDSAKRELDMKKMWNTIFRLKVLSFQIRTLKICQQEAIETIEALHLSLNKISKDTNNKKKLNRGLKIEARINTDTDPIPSEISSGLGDSYNSTQKPSPLTTSISSRHSLRKSKQDGSIGSIETSLSMEMAQRTKQKIVEIPSPAPNPIRFQRKQRKRQGTPKFIRTYSSIDVSDEEITSKE